MIRYLLPLLVLAATPALARDSLGMFGNWGAFRDPGVPLCYAIAMADKPRGAKVDYRAYADVGHWPKRALRNQIHFRLSKRLAASAPDPPAGGYPGLRADRRRGRCVGRRSPDGCGDRRRDALGQGDAGAGDRGQRNADQRFLPAPRCRQRDRRGCAGLRSRALKPVRQTRNGPGIAPRPALATRFRARNRSA